MQQITVDFEVWKALIARLESESDSYNEVIRRLLSLPASENRTMPGEIDTPGIPDAFSLPSGEVKGVWFSNVFFPDNTQFRATYKGRSHRAQIQNSQWIDEFGQQRTSPSDAASAISRTNVNGWRFWFVRRPFDEDWQRLDALRP
jgi:hypothetical protein